MNTSKELVLDEKATLTFKLENKRAVASGILETASTTFILLIAVRVFNANPTVKWLVSSGDSIGFLLSPFVVALITSLKLRTTKGAAVFAAFGFIAYLIAALSNNIWLFVVGSMVGACCRTVIIPINTQIYQDNYPDDSRGKLYSKSSFIKLVTTAIFSYVAGRFLELELSFYYLLLLIFSFAHLLSYHLLRKCPGRFIKRNKTSLFQGFQYLQNIISLSI